MDKNTFEGITYFVELAKLGSITLVSKSLNIDHKTIKQKVLLLEKKLNKNLIDSSHLGTKLTEDGWVFYQQISQSYKLFNQSVDDSFNEITSSNNDSVVTLNLLIPPATSLYFTYHILPTLYKKFPNINLYITSFDAWYMVSYGSHLRTLLNNFNFVMIDDASMQLINPDEWICAYRLSEIQKLYCTSAYIEEKDIKTIDDLNQCHLISRAGTFEESGVLKLINRTENVSTKIHFKNRLSAKNDLVKSHLANKGFGITFLSDAILNCGQQLDLINIFPEYEGESKFCYSFLYKDGDIHTKYIKEMVSLIKQSIKDNKLRMVQPDSQITPV